MLSKKSNTKEYINNNAPKTRAVLEFAGGGEVAKSLSLLICSTKTSAVRCNLLHQSLLDFLAGGTPRRMSSW